MVFNRPVDTGTTAAKPSVPAKSMTGYRKQGENGYVIADRPEILAAFAKPGAGLTVQKSLFSLVAEILGNMGIWGENLHGIPGLTRAVSRYLAEIIKNGMRETVEKLLRARYKTI